MEITQTTIDTIKKLRNQYFNSLPQFQELFIELMVKDSDFYMLRKDFVEIGYVIKNHEGTLIEFYVANKYIPKGNVYFSQVLRDLSITGIYCKSFDPLLLGNCLKSGLSYSLLGLLYRHYVGPLIKKDPEIKMKKADLSSVGFLLGQKGSIEELFETEQQLMDFIINEHVFEFYNNEGFMGCGMVIRTHPDWDFCDLGVWVQPSKRGNAFGSQIIIYLREFALKNNLKPSCGCAIENVASQKAIEKSGFVSKYQMVHFKTAHSTKA
jgi:hypothetical protein